MGVELEELPCPDVEGTFRTGIFLTGVLLTDVGVEGVLRSYVEVGRVERVGVVVDSVLRTGVRRTDVEVREVGAAVVELEPPVEDFCVVEEVLVLEFDLEVLEAAGTSTPF